MTTRRIIHSSDKEDIDWRVVAKQLMQAISLIDTHTDGVNEGTEDPDGAIKAIDNETSRLLWGMQSEDNKLSSYQNANYFGKTANGFMMDNPAKFFNDMAYDEEEK